MADQDLVNQNFAADIADLKASNAALIQKIAEDGTARISDNLGCVAKKCGLFDIGIS